MSFFDNSRFLEELRQKDYSKNAAGVPALYDVILMMHR